MRTAFACILLWSTATWGADDSGAKLLDAVRKGDTAAVQSLLTAGASANSKDDTGATALMYAGAYGSLASMKLLLDNGADANSADTAQATALMWSVDDFEKVKLLVDRGAKVNARSSSQQSALLLAARRPNSMPTVRFLLAHGADPTALDKHGAGLLVTAYSTPNPALLEMLHAAGVKLTTAQHLGPFPLLTVLDSHDPVRIAEVLKLGASINEALAQVTDKMPVLGVLAYGGAVPVVGMLLQQGADPNSKGDRGFTPLMMAAGADRPEPEVIRMLLQKGANVNLQDASGRTALDWALPQGDTATVRMLREAGGKSMARSVPAPPAVTTPRSARSAVEAALPTIQPFSKAFHDNYGCISCHNQSLPSMAVAHAQAHGIAVDAALASHPSKSTLAELEDMREMALQGTCLDHGGYIAIVSYGLAALLEEGVTPNRDISAAALCLARSQAENGAWMQNDMRPPLSGNPIVYTALALRTLGTYLPEGVSGEWKTRSTRGREFLRKAEPVDTQEAAFLLMGLYWAGAPQAEIDHARQRLLARQSPDGGWSHKPSMTADPYATGQSLHALHVAGMAATQDPYRKGVAYLLRTQRQDGTWFMATRAFGFQPYYDVGFPYKEHQFISIAATSWATLALDHAL